MSFGDLDIVHRFDPYPFCVVKYDLQAIQVYGFSHGLHYTLDDPRWPVYLGPLRDEDFDPFTFDFTESGGFSNFTFEMPPLDFSIVSRKGKCTPPIWEAIVAANACNRPWSVRVMHYRGDTRYTFGFVNETQMVEFKLRW